MIDVMMTADGMQSKTHPLSLSRWYCGNSSFFISWTWWWASWSLLVNWKWQCGKFFQENGNGTESIDYWLCCRLVLNLSWSDAGHPEDAKPWQWWSMMMKNRRQVVRRPLLIFLRRHWPSVSIRRRLICTVTVMWTVQGRDTLYLLILKILIYLIMSEREKDWLQSLR